MAPLPPPPPPAPPPPPMAAMPASVPKMNKSDASDRNALLSSIRSGTKLKKVAVVNDRSSPLIDGKSSTSGSSKTTGNTRPAMNGPNQLGGLFAHGVPKLKSSSNSPANSDAKLKFLNSDNEARNASSTLAIKTSLEAKLQFSNSQTNPQNNAQNSSQNNSFLHSKTSPLSENNGLITNKNKFHTINLSKPRERSNIISSEGKGQAPQVPTVADSASAPQLPKKPLGVQRSNSSNSRNAGRVTRPGPPTMKPPPPPKMPNGNSAPQPPIPSKPPNSSNRRQSFDDEPPPDKWNAKPDISALVNNFNNQGLRSAPSRNNSLTNGFAQSPAFPPPPPPPISTIPSRTNNGSAPRLPQVNKQTAPLPSAAQFQTTIRPNIRPPIGPPPPPPPHRTTSNNPMAPPPPHRTTSNNSVAPPPPPSQTKVNPNSVRNGLSALSSAPQSLITKEEFAARFATFRAICELPAPVAMSNSNKQYPSQLQQSQRRRDPPPPPPQQMNGTTAQNSSQLNAHNGKKYPSTPMLHIQFGSSVAQC